MSHTLHFVSPWRCRQSGFSQTHNIGNNASIGTSDKMLPPVSIEPLDL